MILIDTSIWIEYFQKKPTVDVSAVDLLIEERSAATCLPIKAEVLSGEMTTQTRSVVTLALNALESIDPNWNSDDIWNQITQLSIESRKRKIGLPGIVDRMILISAKLANAQIWTLDKKMKQLAPIVPVTLF
ncbi:MAG: PIN domain-containing protein [Deltaproteobacteria bacterium]|nr:PIN domain-containing protein [Deltaproteobacteria bacterium]